MAPIYTDGLREASPKGTDYYDGSFGSAFGATVSEAIDELPTSQAIGLSEINAARGGARQAPETDALGNAIGGMQEPDVGAAPVPQISTMLAKQRVKEAGLEKDLTLPAADQIAAPVLDIMIGRARHRRELQATIDAGPDNLANDALSVGTSFLVGALDPINLASAFIPVMGEARYGKLMASAGESVMRRAATRTAVGAAQGVVGQAALEPLDYYAHNQEGRDFGMVDILQNLVFGGVLGGALQGGGGFVADKFRARKGIKAYPFGPNDVLGNMQGTSLSGSAIGDAGTTIDNVPDHLIPNQVTPAVTILNDLPPRAKEDAMRGAIASLIEGEPVKVGEMLHAAAGTDPRIAESFEAFHGPQRPIDTAPAAPRFAAPDGVAEVRREGDHFNVYVNGELDGAFNTKGEADLYASRGEKFDVKLKVDPEQFVDLDRPVKDQHPIVREALKPHALDEALPAGEILRNHPDKDALAKQLADSGVHGAKYIPPGSLPDVGASMVVFNDSHIEVSSRAGASIEPGHLPNEAADPAPRKSTRPIHDDVLQQLRDAGVPQHQAAENAAVVEARYHTRAERLGLEREKAHELYKSEGLRIRRGDVEAAVEEHSFSQVDPRVTETPAFKKWFGDSRVVDDTGAPIVVYRGEHGVVDGDKLQSRVGSFSFTANPESAGTYAEKPNNRAVDKEASAPRVTPVYLKLERPFLLERDDPFVDLKPIIDAVGKEKAMEIALKNERNIEHTNNWEEIQGETGATSVREFLQQHPDRLKDLYFEAYHLFDDPEAVGQLKAAGFDGAIHGGSGETSGEPEYKVFSESQVKSAIGNRGTFSSDDPRVLYQRSDLPGQLDLAGTAKAGDGDRAQRAANAPMKPKVAQKPMDMGLFGDEAAQIDMLDMLGGKSYDQATGAPVYYSAVDRVIAASKQDKATAEQWLGMLKNATGVKADEMKWLGLDDWLKEQKGPISKKAIGDFVRANQIEIKEVKLGDKHPAIAAVENANGRLIEQYGDLNTAWDKMDPLEYERHSDLNEAASDLRDEKAQELYETSYYGLRDFERDLVDQAVNGPDTKWGQYTLPGGENYRELLLTLPDPEFSKATAAKRARWQELDDGFVQWGLGKAPKLTAEEMAERTKLMLEISAAESGRDVFRSVHFDAPNILSHIRFNDRTIDGKRALFLEEIQSDWHQNGRKKGYNTPEQRKISDDARAAREALQPEVSVMLRRNDQLGFDSLGEAIRAIGNEGPGGWEFETPADAALALKYHEARKLERANPVDRESDRVPDAPFKTTWPELALKRMIRYAAENDYELVAWGGGETNPTNPKNLGRSDEAAEAANEGMKGFYDKIIPAAANKLIKKFGGKVEESAIERPTRAADEPVSGEIIGRSLGIPESQISEWFAAFDHEGREKLFEDYRAKSAAATKTAVHTISISPEIRTAALEEGFPLFQNGEGEPRGRITLNNNRAVIQLFKEANESTFMHEAGHLWLDEMVRDGARADVPAALRQDLDTVLKWLGVEKAQDIGTAQHEQWARGFEQYLAEGNAPSIELASAFAKFKDWLMGIYKRLASLGTPITDEIRGVMNRMLATDTQIAAMAAQAPGRLADESGIAGRPSEPAPAPTPAAPKRGRAAADPQTWSLNEFLASKGGLKPTADLEAIYGNKRGPFVPGFGPLIRKGGMSLDDAFVAAKESFYAFDPNGMEHAQVGSLPTDHRMGELTLTQDHLLGMLDEESRGRKQYRLDHLQETKFDPAEELHRIRQELEHQIEATGGSLKDVDPALLDRTVEIVKRDGETDVLNAFERAIMEDAERYNGLIETRRADPDIGHIPGWDVDPDAGATSALRGSDPVASGDAGRAGQGEGGINGPQSRADRIGPSAAPEQSWRDLARPSPEFNDADVLAASRFADLLPEPVKTRLDERVAAALSAESDSEKLYDLMKAGLSEADRKLLDDTINDLKLEGKTREEAIRRGGACMFGKGG